MSEILLPLAERRDSRLNFRLVLLSVFLERFALYGLYAVIFIYATINLQITDSDIVYLLGLNALASTLGRLAGGLLSDFLTGPKMTMIIGLSVCLTGGILTLIENSSIFFPAMLILFFGAGFFRTSSYSFIGHLSSNQPVLLEKRFILNYIAINLGSMFSTLILGLIGEYYGFSYAIIAVCLVYGFSILAITRARASRNDFSLVDSVQDAQIQSKSTVKFVILAIVGAAFFSFSFELYESLQADRLNPEGIFLFGRLIPNSVSYAIPAIVSLLLIVPYYFLATKLSITFKLAFGCFLLAALWLIWIPLSSSSLGLGVLGLLFFGLMETIIEFFMTLTMNTFICRYSPKKIYGTLFGIEAVLTYAVGLMAGLILTLELSSITSIFLGVPLIGVGIYFLYLRKKFQPFDNFRLEKKEVD